MKPLYTQKEFESAKSNDKLPCECKHCNKTFYKPKRSIVSYLHKTMTLGAIDFCSKYCAGKNQFKNNQAITVICKNCDKPFQKRQGQIKKSPNHFCSKSCAATYHNQHKTTGTRRSKFETYLEQELSTLYPNLEIHYNRKDAINSELDVYIPSLQLAFELNGIFHYEPIYGSDKLFQIQNNDHRKFQACIERGIEMCIIDTSNLKYFKENTSKQYLDIITNIINIKISKNKKKARHF